MPSEADAAFIRGAAAPALPGAARIMRAVVIALLVTLAVLVVVFTVEGVAHRNRIERLRSAGVPVRTVVTGCTGSAGGTGITVAYFTCTGTFRVDGVPHAAVIHGNTALLAPGTELATVVDPRDPSTLSTPGAVSGAWSGFVPAAATLGVLLAISLAYRLARRRRLTPAASAGQVAVVAA